MTGRGQTDPIEIARRIVDDTGINLFLTGKAGTGKTTFLHRLVDESPKRIVTLAPTGVAAINAGGVTIHSFFQLDFAPYIPGSRLSGEGVNRFSKEKINIIRTLDLIVIDEISMVRPDVMDAMDVVLRRYRNPLKPFGGAQLLLIGDMHQLAPVAQEQEWNILKNYYSSPYFFESKALKEAGFLMIELKKVYRQNDLHFIEILNKIRDNKLDAASLAELNLRADRALMPADGEDAGYIRLTTHNYRADSINARRMAKLPGEGIIYEAGISGKFPESSYPADSNLLLKEGAQVMFIKNDPSGSKAYYNGLIGYIVSLAKDEIIVAPRVSADTGFPTGAIKVNRVDWENKRYTLQDNGEITEEIEGRFSQFPLRPAWAITIHKSQGLTFDKAIIDAAASFAPGQTYVALSRCRSLESLILETPLHQGAIMTDPTVSLFIQQNENIGGSFDSRIEDFEAAYHFSQLTELFDFRSMENAFDAYYRAAALALAKKNPTFMLRIDDMREMLHSGVMDVSYKMQKFLQTRYPYRKDPEVAEAISKKVKGGSEYFFGKLKKLREVIILTPTEVENKTSKKQLKKALNELNDLITPMLTPLQIFSREEFSPREYLNAKTRGIINMGGSPKNSKSKKKK